MIELLWGRKKNENTLISHGLFTIVSCPLQAAELDLGLIAVGTSGSGKVRVRNIGAVPVSFTVVQAGEHVDQIHIDSILIDQILYRHQ